MNAECSCKLHGPGTPVLQMMVHCLSEDECDKFSVTMLEYFIKEERAKLGGEIATQHIGLQKERVTYGMLDLLLSMKRIDSVKMIVQEGVDPINGACPGGEKFDVVPMFQEYRDHGTNEFIRWTFNEYVPQHPEVDLKKFARRTIQSISNMKSEKSNFWKPVKRAPAHAVLMSHHKKAIQHLVQCAKDDFCLDLLAERSCTGKTALHVAAEINDVKSVRILLQV